MPDKEEWLLAQWQEAERKLARADYTIRALLMILRHQFKVPKDSLAKVMREIAEKADFIFSEE